MNLGVVSNIDSVRVKVPRLGVICDVASERTEHRSVKSFYLPTTLGIICGSKQVLDAQDSADILKELESKPQSVIGE